MLYFFLYRNAKIKGFDEIFDEKKKDRTSHKAEIRERNGKSAVRLGTGLSAIPKVFL